MSQTTNNSRNESLIGSEELSAMDETVSLDATGEKVDSFRDKAYKSPYFLLVIRQRRKFPLPASTRTRTCLHLDCDRVEMTK
jgi:hypothetical protein